jgi:alpha-L-fucosidase
VFTHVYAVDLLVAQRGMVDAATVRLPDDPALVVLAASMVERGDRLMPACELVDRPQRPSVSFTAPRLAFVDTLSVSVTSPNERARITIARNGGAPEPYTGQPIVLAETTTLTATALAAFPEPITRTATFTRLDPWPADASAAGLAPGLATSVYHGAWDALPDWSALMPAQDLVSDVVSLPDGLPDEDVGLVLRGWLTVPTTGVYRFWLSSDDGSRLWVGGHEVIDHDGLHGSSAVWGDAPLAAGSHPIVVEFFQHLGGRDLKLEWSGPGFGRQVVPTEVLGH